MNIYFPLKDTKDKDSSCSLFDELTQIAPFYPVPENRWVHIKKHYGGIQDLIRKMIAKECFDLKSFEQFDNEQSIRRAFNKSLLDNCPLIKSSFHEKDELATLSVSILFTLSFTREVGRFICDYFSKWLVPGKIIHLSYVHSSTIKFKNAKGRAFFFHEMFIEINNPKDLKIAKQNLSSLCRELKINISAVCHARRVMSAYSLTDEQKKLIIQENISELLDIPSRGYNHNLFEQMQHFLLKTFSEQKIAEIKENLSPLLDLKPEIFERDLFNEIQRFILPTTKKFTQNRKISHITRVISYSYLLRKWGAYAFIKNPAERFAFTKVLRTKDTNGETSKKITGILVAINYLSENELFDERHLTSAIANLIPEIRVVSDSVIHNKREFTGTRIIYLEVEKINGNFSFEQIKLIKNSLTDEILDGIESLTNTIFMPRNEEEVFRNILTLNNQLRFPSDLPQVMINYLSQEKSHLLFTVILVRIEHENNLPILAGSKGIKNKIFINEKEEKTIGLIRKKIPKKAYILEIHCPKKKYLRKDLSVDLRGARKDVFDFISDIAGEIRDFNGGMIAKQNDVLIELKRELLQNGPSEDFLIDNFFYSFTPRFMQCILPPPALKHSFLLLQSALEHDFSKEIYFIKTITWQRYFIITVATINPTFKEFIEDKISLIDFDPSSLCISYTNIHEIPVLSYILNFSDLSQQEKLLKTLVEGIKEWKTSIF